MRLQNGFITFDSEKTSKLLINKPKDLRCILTTQLKKTIQLTNFRDGCF